MDVRYIICQKLGIDKAIFYTLLGRGAQIATALFTVLFVARYLTPDEQGYYYTFGSITAIQVFFELGLTGIITQFVAHEVSHLEIKDNQIINGDIKYRSRLASLLKFCAKWYTILAALLFVLLLIIGFLFFYKYNVNSNIVWEWPWVILALGTTLNFLLSPFIAIIEGFGKVKEIAQIRFWQQLTSPLVLWAGLILGSKLFVSGIYTIYMVILAFILILKAPYFCLLRKLLNGKTTEEVSYRKEIYPYQWRIALSWISGFFIFQLFNPVLFATEGAIVAGQMGMTIAALNGLQALTQSWINTKVPKMSGLIALKQFGELDSLFYKTFYQMLIVGSFVIIVFVLAIAAIQYYDIKPLGLEIGDRFLPIIPLILMSWAVFTSLPINCWATYLRCHKKEPLLLNSITMGILCCASTLIFGKLFGLMGMTIGYASLKIVSITWIYIVFKNKKKEWHYER